MAEPGIHVVRCAGEEALCEAVCDLVCAEIGGALASRGIARIILAGGGTPRGPYRLLARRIARERQPLERLRWFFGDERWVPPNSAESNEGMARETLLGPLRAPESTIFSWNAGSGDPVECARLYGETLSGSTGQEGPVADILLLGMGGDGHTASLYPDGVVHLSDGRLAPVGPELAGTAAAVWVPRLSAWRLTLCPVFLRNARCTGVLVSGAEKAPVLRRALKGDPRLPLSWVLGGAAVTVLATDDALEDGGYGGREKKA